MDAVYPGPFDDEPERDLSSVDALIAEVERQAALLAAVATGGPRIHDVQWKHQIAGEPADRRALATRGRVSVPMAGPLAMLRPLDEEPWALREAPRGGPNGHRSKRQTTTSDVKVAACRRREWPRMCHRFQLATGVAQAGTAILQCRQRSTTSSTKRSGKTAMKSALIRASIQVSGPEPEATTFSQIGP